MSVDPLEPTKKMVGEMGFTFPVAYGVTEEEVAALDPWWTEDNHGRYIQPLELLRVRGGTIFGSMYASGPIGRMDVEEVIASVRGRERRRLEQQEQAAASQGQRSR